MRCVVSCGSTSFPWLVFFFGALLWGSMIHKHTGRWMWEGSASVIFWSWQKYSRQSKLVSALSMLLLSVLSWKVSQAWTLISYNWGILWIIQLLKHPACSVGWVAQLCRNADSLMVSIHPHCVVTCVNICVHVKDPVVHVRIWWIIEML